MDLLTYLLLYLLAAAVIGWVATEIMQDRSILLSNISIAAASAVMTRYWLIPILNIGPINDAITFPTVLVTLFGSIILLAIINLLLGRRLRDAQAIY